MKCETCGQEPDGGPTKPASRLEELEKVAQVVLGSIYLDEGTIKIQVTDPKWKVTVWDVLSRLYPRETQRMARQFTGNHVDEGEDS